MNVCSLQIFFGKTFPVKWITLPSLVHSSNFFLPIENVLYFLIFNLEIYFWCVCSGFDWDLYLEMNSLSISHLNYFSNLAKVISFLRKKLINTNAFFNVQEMFQVSCNLLLVLNYLYASILLKELFN